MSNEQIFERIKEIYNQRIMTKQELTEDEMSFLDEHFDKMREEGLIDDVSFSNFLIGSLSNPSFNFDSSETLEIFRSLKELDVWNQTVNYGNGDFTRYEVLLHSALTDRTLNLNSNDMFELINELKHPRFVEACLHNPELTEGYKLGLLHSFEQQKYASRNEYFQMLNGLAQSDDLGGFNRYVLLSKIKDAYQYRAEEVKEGQDPSYDALLYLTAHNMKDLDEYHKKDLIYSLRDINYVRSIVENEYKEFNLSNPERVALISRSGNREYIEQILKGDIHIDIGDDGLRRLVIQSAPTHRNGDEDYYLQYANSEDYKFSMYDRVKFAILSGNKDATKQFLESNELTPLQQVELLQAIGDRVYGEQFIERQPETLRMYVQDQYIRELGSETEKQDWNGKITTIPDISKLSLEELEKLPEHAMIRVLQSGEEPSYRDLYTKEKYAEILKNIEQKFGDIKPAIQGDKESEMRTFLEVYNRMGRIPYDDYAVSDEGKKEQLLQITTRNLQGGLQPLEGRCVCGGYAEILRNVLAQKGIEAKEIIGHDSEDGGSHAWNQVKIGGQWFNTDLTWNRDEIEEMDRRGERIGPEVLKTDEEFVDHQRYKQNRTISEEKCNIGVRKLMPNYQHQRTVPIEGISEDIPNNEIPTENATIELNDDAHNNEQTATIVEPKMSIHNVERHEIPVFEETTVGQEPIIEESIVQDPIMQSVQERESTIPTEQNNIISNNQPAQIVQQDIGIQVQNMLQANQITTAEFVNQARQIEQMQQIQQVQQMQNLNQMPPVPPAQGMEIGM